jgi:hypothetical protein
MITPTVAQELQKNKFFLQNNNQIIRVLEIYKITSNKNLTINDDL